MTFKTVFDADFKYRSADTTDVRLTFARIRREQQKVLRRKERERLGAEVVPIGANKAQTLKEWPFPAAAA